MDGLTTLKTFRELEAEIACGVVCLRDYHAAALFDIDTLIAFNDQYGFMQGEYYLRLVGSKLKETFLGTQICVRWAGEEFLVLMQEANNNYDKTADLLAALVDKNTCINCDYTNVKYFSVSACFIENICVNDFEQLSKILVKANMEIENKKERLDARKYKKQGVLAYAVSL